jgi:DNA-binding LacI/PurR family transcriptional regulator
MFDVATLSGVSHQTVSRVLNNHVNVSDKTRKKVLAAMAELNYRPNNAARTLVTGKSSSIGVLSYDTTLFGPASMLHSVQLAARTKGYSVNLVSLKATDSESVNKGLQDLYGTGVEGLIMIVPNTDDSTAIKNLPGNLPGVLIEGESSKNIPSVNIDQELGAEMAVDYLIDLGHKKIAHISGPLGWYEADLRVTGWKNALERAKLKSSVNEQGDWSPRSGYIATKRILESHPEITAIFCANDAMALGALKALAENNISVPAQMSVVGFDDVPEASYFQPSLTTVQQSFEQVGNASLELLVSQIEGGKVKIKREAIKPSLLVRESSGRVRRK